VIYITKRAQVRAQGNAIDLRAGNSEIPADQEIELADNGHEQSQVKERKTSQELKCQAATED